MRKTIYWLVRVVADVDILEDRVDTQIVCVFEQNVRVIRSPRDPLCFEPPTNVTPEVKSFFNVTFLILCLGVCSKKSQWTNTKKKGVFIQILSVYTFDPSNRKLRTPRFPTILSEKITQQFC